MKKTMRIIAGILLAFFVFWGSSIAKCEVLTMIYGDRLESRCSNFNMWENINEFKVISWSPSTIKTYAVCDNQLGNHIYFVKRRGIWYSNYYNVRWSRFGNADEVVWPYIR